MVKYENSKIYKIVCNKTGLIYIGSTCEKYISKRLQHHLGNYKHWLKNNIHYMSSFEIFKNGDYEIQLIENVNCNDIYQLKNRERYHIENNDCVNINIPNRTEKERANTPEYKQKRAVLNKIHNKKYYEENKEKINNFRKEKVKCECGCLVTRKNLERHKKTEKHINLIEFISD